MMGVGGDRSTHNDSDDCRGKCIAVMRKEGHGPRDTPERLVYNQR